MREFVDVNSILKDFYMISGIRISIHDAEFNEIYSYPGEHTPFCRCIQKNKAVFKDCINNDAAAFAKVAKTGEVTVYKCNRGLYEAVAPIYHYGKISGYLMMGQICDADPASMDYIVNRAAKILGDKSQAIEISRTIKAIDRKLINSYINIMILLAEYLTSTNRLFAHNDKLPQLVKEYINKNYASKITLTILSQKFGCCNATLTKSFKKEYNSTIMGYLTEVRLQKAEDFVRKSRNSFKEISADCGFYDQNYFSKSFTKRYGCSPTEYREKHSGRN